MAEERKNKYEVPLDGKLVTWDDPIKIGTNFQQLTNMGYTSTHPKGVGGMTKINTSVIDATYLKVRSGIHFRKDQPQESHVLTQAFNTGLSASRILQNTTAIPSAGDFSATSLYTPTGTTPGRWSIAPDGDVAYCNSEESCIWGGAERKVSGFINYDPDGSFSYDYTKEVQNTLTTAGNIAVLNSIAGGLDSDVMLLLSLDNNVTDTSPATIHTVGNYTKSNGSIANEHMTTLSGWADDDGAGAAAESTQTPYSGYETFKFDGGTAQDGTAHATRTKDVGTIGDTAHVVSIRLYNDLVGALAADDEFRLTVDGATYQLIVKFCSDGLFVYDGAAYNEVGTDIVNLDAWNEWTFDIDATTPASATCTVYKNGVSQATGVDCSNVPTGTDGTIELKQNSQTTVSQISYVDWVKVGAASTAVTFSTTKVFGSHSAVFSGADWLEIPDNADFDLSGEAFTIDGRFRVDNLTTNHPIFYQQTDLASGAQDYFYFYIDTNGAVKLSIYENGSEVVAVTTPNSVISAATWYHISLVQSASDWYIFVDGISKGYASDASRAADYTSAVFIGRNDGAAPVYFDGYIDELRVSDVARHTTNFEIPTVAYLDSATTGSIYLGAIRPLDGFKLTMGTANATASTMSVYYWTGSAWVSVSNLFDGTSASSKSLAQTGSVTFDSTESAAKVKYIDGVVVYWYKIALTAISSLTSVAHATVSCPFQTIKDIWDAFPVPIDSFQIYDDSAYVEATLNVRENEYVSTDTGTYADISSLAAGTDYFICGFSERISGAVLSFVAGSGNSTPNTVATVSYWSGTAWVSVGDVADGTIEAGISLANSGAITWSPPTAGSEFTSEISNTAQLHYYKFTFSQALSATTYVYYISAIPVQRDISAYKFPFLANDRLWLCCDEKGKKNSVICSAEGSSSVFNGYDTVEIEFGDDTEVMGASWLYSQYGSSIFNISLFFKKNETWALVGNGPENWVKYRVSDVVGCPTPETIKVIDIGPQSAQTLNRSLAVWQGSDGIYSSDGRTPIKISEDINDKFDQRATSPIYSSKVDDSVATWDSYNKCYHWLWASGTSSTLNEEYVLDFEKLGWFNIDRTSTKDLQYAIEVEDTTGLKYNYGFIDTGYMLRLEYGNDFDGQDIAHTVHFGDMVLAGGSIVVETDADYFCVMAKAKTSTSSEITFTHYGDSSTTGTSWTKSVSRSGFRVISPVYHKSLGGHLFHSVKMQISTDNETVGFEPLYFYILYSKTRDHLRDWRT
jgi:hypothetical protein